MALTREQNKAAYAHILKLMNQEPGGKVDLALQQEDYHRDVETIAMAPDEDINALEYIDENVVKPLTKAGKGAVRVWKAFVVWKSTSGEPMNPQDYVNVAAAEYNEFKTTTYLRTVVAANPPPVTASSSKPSYTASELFDKGIKRDPSVFQALKMDQRFDTWDRETVALLVTQGCSNVTDKDYAPITMHDRELFKKQNDYVYAVFLRTLLTDIGKSLVRKHAKTEYRAQAIYVDLVKEYKESIKSTLDSDDYQDYIANARLGPGSTWKGDTIGFIKHYREQIRLFEQLVPDAEKYPDGAKMRMLMRAVGGIESLDQIRVQAEQLKSQLGTRMSWEQYLNLLESAARVYDKKHEAKPSRVLEGCKVQWLRW